MVKLSVKERIASRRGHIGYKVCQPNKLVTLRIDGRHNEARCSVRRCQTAKYRCALAHVLDITDLYTGEHCETARSEYDDNFLYTKGKTVKPNAYDEEVENVQTHGIHYFLSRKAALHYSDFFRYSDGVQISYDPNGMPVFSQLVMNGKSTKKYYFYDERGRIERCEMQEPDLTWKVKVPRTKMK